ncbi:PA2169 family four-helix-bundle protein [Acidipila sp. EB88]|nr:PA2169 family four-helix-bundle protein [Acidipila sp. EB88]
MAENIDHEKVKATLSKLVDVLKDSHKGFTELGKHIKDEPTRLFFLKETQERANFAGELENELHRLGVADVHQSGMVSGTLHRAWGELKANLGGGDHALLATAEQGEDVAKKAYKLALEEHLPADIRDVLTRQQTHIVASHDRVRDLRDAKVSS